MRKVILFIACSLDGFIARKDHGIDWLFTDADYGYKKFYASVDALILGRMTYELALTFGDWPYMGKRCYVATRRKKPVPDSRVEFVSDPLALARRLRKQGGKDIWLVGGGQLVSLFLDARLIDELRIFVHPLLLGEGVPLFPGIGRDIALKFAGSKAFPSGLVELCYRTLK